MTVLATIAAVVLIIVGLVSVSWPVLLLLLVAGWIAAQRALASIQTAESRPVHAGPTLDDLAATPPITPTVTKTAIPKATMPKATMPNHEATASVVTTDPKGKCLKYRGAVYECPDGIPDQTDCCEITVEGKYRGFPLTVRLRSKPLLSDLSKEMDSQSVDLHHPVHSSQAEIDRNPVGTGKAGKCHGI
ncbi:hypothetical protein [Trichothermofontia sp.]